MATVNIGSLKFNWKGTYNGSTAYAIDDVTEYNGSSYICILASTGNLPTNTTYFQPMATKGTDGTDVSTTLTTQGDILYRDGSGLQRLPKGTAGQVLQMNSGATAPEYGTVSSDFVLIKTQSLTYADNASGIDFIHGTSGVVFDGTYKSYKFIMKEFAPQNATDINALVIINGTAQTSGYATENFRSYYSGGTGRSGQSNKMAFANYGMQGSSTSNASIGYSEFMCGDPTYNGYPQMMSHHSGAEHNQNITSMCAGKWQTTTSQWNGMRFKTSDGSQFQGKISLYGIKG